jgi:hypothetical protein
MKLDEAEARIRADLERDRRHLEYRRREFDQSEAALLEREATIAEAAAALVDSENAAKQHARNVRTADRVARYRLGDAPRDLPTADEVCDALAHFQSTDDVFRIARPYKEPDEAALALVAIHRADTQSMAESAERADREAAIQRLITENGDADYAATRALQERLER